MSLSSTSVIPTSFHPKNIKKQTIMKKLFSIIIPIVCTVFLSACRSCDVAVQGITSETWNIVEVKGKVISEYDQQPFIMFAEDGRYNGNASVNNFFGEYTIKGESISFSDAGMTRKMGRSMQTETEIMQALFGARKIKVSGNDVTLSDENGKELLKLSKASR